MSELRRGKVSKKSHKYFTSLWATYSPKGNIYRHNGLDTERLKNAEDLWIQLYEVADAHKNLLGGDSVSQQDRAQKLCSLLLSTTVTGSPDLQNEEEDVGFHPVEEYLAEKVSRIGPFVYPR